MAPTRATGVWLGLANAVCQHMLTDVTRWDMPEDQRIDTTSSVIDQLEASLAEAVAEARAAGATWADVAGALGVTRQSAWRRFKEVRVKPVQKRCSFCGEPQNKVKQLVCAPTGAAICDQCLDLAYSLLPTRR